MQQCNQALLALGENLDENLDKNIDLAIEYVMERKLKEEPRKVLKEKIKWLLENLDILNISDEMERAKMLYMYMVDNVRFYHDYKLYPSKIYETGYAALVKGQAICTGVSEGMQLLLSSIGIESIKRTGILPTSSGNIEHYFISAYINDELRNIDCIFGQNEDDPLKYFDASNEVMHERLIRIYDEAFEDEWDYDSEQE